MKLLTFITEKGESLGVKTDHGVLDIARSVSHFKPDYEVAQTVDQVLPNGQEAVLALAKYVQEVDSSGNRDFFLPENELRIGPCVPRPGKIIGVGLNYKGYLKDSNTPVPAFPYLFNKYINAIRGQGDEITLPFNSAQVDYEAELVIVIGKKARRVDKEKALNCILGYCNGNDLSARDLQYSTASWFPGKCCDDFCPIGPYLVTSDEVGDPNNLVLKAYVNGELRQNSNTSDMVLGCGEIVSAISQLLTLEPGDIILTGTPEGIVMTYPEAEQVWLQDGDMIEVEIEKLGRLTNTVKKENISTE